MRRHPTKKKKKNPYDLCRTEELNVNSLTAVQHFYQTRNIKEPWKMSASRAERKSNNLPLRSLFFCATKPLYCTTWQKKCTTDGILNTLPNQSWIKKRLWSPFGNWQIESSHNFLNFYETIIEKKYCQEINKMHQEP